MNVTLYHIWTHHVIIRPINENPMEHVLKRQKHGIQRIFGRLTLGPPAPAVEPPTGRRPNRLAFQDS